jgi:uncharacterized membrane protein YphA (DoxX/SURF4 family)
MKIIVLIARLLLGLMFLVFGLNGFLHFIPQPPIEGTAGAFIGALVVSHYSYLVFGVQLIAGVLLLTNQFVPLAVALLAPMLANILTFHLAMQPQGLPPGIFATLLWAVIAWAYRGYFASLFTQKATLSV